MIDLVLAVLSLPIVCLSLNCQLAESSQYLAITIIDAANIVKTNRD